MPSAITRYSYCTCNDIRKKVSVLHMLQVEHVFTLKFLFAYSVIAGVVYTCSWNLYYIWQDKKSLSYFSLTKHNYTITAFSHSWRCGVGWVFQKIYWISLRIIRFRQHIKVYTPPFKSTLCRKFKDRCVLLSLPLRLAEYGFEKTGKIWKAIE